MWGGGALRLRFGMRSTAWGPNPIDGCTEGISFAFAARRSTAGLAVAGRILGTVQATWGNGCRGTNIDGIIASHTLGDARLVMTTLASILALPHEVSVPVPFPLRARAPLRSAGASSCSLTGFGRRNVAGRVAFWAVLKVTSGTDPDIELSLPPCAWGVNGKNGDDATVTAGRPRAESPLRCVECASSKISGRPSKSLWMLLSMSTSPSVWVNTDGNALKPFGMEVL
jgi:hypothetical protein